MREVLSPGAVQERLIELPWSKKARFKMKNKIRIKKVEDYLRFIDVRLPQRLDRLELTNEHVSTMASSEGYIKYIVDWK